MITLIQWDGSNVTPADDAALYAHFDGRSGIISGCVPSSLGSNQIAVSSGRGYICGRQFAVQQETILAQVSSTGEEMQGRLLVQIDLANSEQPITFLTQAAASLPDLVQDDLNNGGTVYQLPLATYTIDSVAISEFAPIESKIPWFMPVQQGGGPSQQTNKIHIGWGRLSEEDPYRVLVSVDSGESLPIATGENTSFSAATMKFTNSGVTVSGGATANLTVNLYKFGRIVFASMDNYPVYFAAANQGYGNTNTMPTGYRPISMVRIAAPSWSSNAAVGTVHVTVQTNGQIVLASTRTAVQEAAWSACWISAS